MKEKKNFEWTSIILISLAHMVHDVFGSFFVPILPLLKSKMGLSNTGVGLLSVIQKTPALLNPLVGVVSDRLPMRIFMVVDKLYIECSCERISLGKSCF